MKTKLRYFVCLALALFCSTFLWRLAWEKDKPTSQPAPATMDEAGPDPIELPSPLAVDANEPTPRAALPAADNTTPETRTESIPARDSQGSRAILDQFARNIATGNASPDELFTALGTNSSLETLTAAVNLLAGKDTASFAGLDALPTPFLDGLSAALRQQKDQENLSRALDAAWRETSDPVVRRRLEGLGIPGLYAARVAQSAAAGETATAAEYLTWLESCEHPGTLQALSNLGGQPGVDLEELCRSAWRWAGQFPALADSADLTTRLTCPAASLEQRIIAAVALAAGAPGAQTAAVLDEAARNQSSAEWRAAFESLRDLVGGTGQGQP
jgi:hypothetical protein